MNRKVAVAGFAGAVALLSVLACGGGYQGAPTPDDGSAPNVVTGTCRDYDVGARTMEVVTGVSFALRTMTFRIHENTEIVSGGRRVRLDDLQANIVVRVEYHVTPEGNLADKITVVMDATGLR